MILPQSLQPDEVIFLMTGLIPNRKSHPLIHRWFGMQFHQGNFETVLDLSDILQRTGLGRTHVPNPGREIDPEPLARLLPRAVHEAIDWMSVNRDEFNDSMQPKLQHHLEELRTSKVVVWQSCSSILGIFYQRRIYSFRGRKRNSGASKRFLPSIRPGLRRR
jgi:hypothetical protein